MSRSCGGFRWSCSWRGARKGLYARSSERVACRRRLAVTRDKKAVIDGYGTCGGGGTPATREVHSGISASHRLCCLPFPNRIRFFVCYTAHAVATWPSELTDVEFLSVWSSSLRCRVRRVVVGAVGGWVSVKSPKDSLFRGA